MWLFKLFSKKKKHTLVFIHGFGIRTTNSYDYLNNTYTSKGYDIYCPRLFDPRNEEDDNWQDWVNRAEEALQKACANSDDVYLFGYSMGGVLATHLSTKYPVKKLILLAPAFEYFTAASAKRLIQSIISADKPVKNADIPTNFFQQFMELVTNLKGSFKNVSVPTLFIHGEDDNVISSKVSKKYFAQLDVEYKRLVIIGGATHGLMNDDCAKDIIVNMVDLFIEEKI